MTKKIITVLTMISFLLLSTFFVQAQEIKKAWVNVEVILDMPYPDDFFNDIELVFEKEDYEVKHILYNVNDYKGDFTLEVGSYDVSANIIGEVAEFYTVSKLSKKFTLDETNVDAAKILSITITDNEEMFEDIVQVPKIEEETLNNEEDVIDDLEGTKDISTLYVIILKAISIMIFLVIIYIGIKRKIEN